MRFSKRVPLVLGLGLLMVQGVGAQEHTYPGSMCTEVQNDRPLSRRSKIVRDEEGQIFNLSPAHTLEVVCPVSGLFTDLSGGSANVFVTDQHPTEDVCCQARLNNVGAYLHSDTVCSANTDTRLQTLSITPPSTGFSFTSRYFHCTIPPLANGGAAASGIRLYRH